MKTKREEAHDRLLMYRDHDSFQGRLAGLMIERQMDMEELARQIKANPSTVGRWFSKQSKPHESRWPAIAKVFKVEADWLFKGMGERDAVPQINPLAATVKRLEEKNRENLKVFQKQLTDCNERIKVLERLEAINRKYIDKLESDLSKEHGAQKHQSA